MTNYLLIAIQAGDALKYSTTINEIDRAAQSVFSFECKTFPNETITSERAQKIYDWVQSLLQQSMTEYERDDQVIRFLELLTVSDEDIVRIDEILNMADIYKQIPENNKMFYERSFHPEICSHCSELFYEANYFHAVLEAAKIYHKAVQIKSKSEKDGQKLMLEVWSPRRGTLKITKCETETDKNVQEGLGFLSAGLMRAVRNPTAHEPAHEWPISEQDCLEILGFISFLMRKLDDAVYHGDARE